MKVKARLAELGNRLLEGDNSDNEAGWVPIENDEDRSESSIPNKVIECIEELWNKFPLNYADDTVSTKVSSA